MNSIKLEEHKEIAKNIFRKNWLLAIFKSWKTTEDHYDCHKEAVQEIYLKEIVKRI